MSLWEPEEAIGRYWHRSVGAAESYPHHPQAAATLADLRRRLAVFYRALGGVKGARVAAVGRAASGHRLRLKQRLGLGTEERLDRPSFDGDTLLLPERLDLFPDPARNVELYFWLAAFFAHAPAPAARADDALQGDIRTLRSAYATTCRVVDAWPGLATSYAALAEAVRNIRPRRRLPPWEAAVEEVIVHLLGGAKPQNEAGARLLAAVHDDASAIETFRAPRGYRSFLPVPLWGEVTERRAGATPGSDAEPGGAGAAADEKRLRAKRRDSKQAERRDPLVLFRFEHLPTLAELLNISRPIEDDDTEGARQAAESLHEISVGAHARKAASRLKLDLDLAPQAVNPAPLRGEFTYPEWDYKQQRYHPAHCRVVAEVANEEGADWKLDAQARRRVQAIRRQFEALRPRRQTFPAQSDGTDLDLKALVRSYADLHAGGAGSDRVYLQTRNAERDLAVAILTDVSLSTDSWVDNRRVLDIAKEAVYALSHGLAACGDTHAIYTFTSRKRARIDVRTVKDFDEPLNDTVRRRLETLQPGYYTRIGAALRHVADRLNERPNRHRLLLLLTDGKPNDADYYEGRYGVEDTRRAVREARRGGLAVFGITIDLQARDYFPYIFGRGAYAIVARPARLPRALPLIYRHITG